MIVWRWRARTGQKYFILRMLSGHACRALRLYRFLYRKKITKHVDYNDGTLSLSPNAKLRSVHSRLPVLRRSKTYGICNCMARVQPESNRGRYKVVIYCTNSLPSLRHKALLGDGGRETSFCEYTLYIRVLQEQKVSSDIISNTFHLFRSCIVTCKI